MRRFWVICALFVLVLATIAPVLAADAAAGKAVFDRLCMACHGPNGVGASGPALNRAAAARNFTTLDQLRSFTSRGARGMPAFGTDVLNDTDLANLQAYLLSLVPAGTLPTPAATTAAAVGAATTAPAVQPTQAVAAVAAATTAPAVQPAQAAQAATTSVLPLEQLYVLAIIAVAAIDGLAMLALWLFVNRKANT